MLKTATESKQLPMEYTLKSMMNKPQSNTLVNFFQVIFLTD